MDKALHSIFNGLFTAIKGPLLVVLMASIVISLIRQRPRRIAPAHARKPAPPP
ncbi:MAG TPA: hypothetical protein VFB31_09420 [Pseudolabrys sp.]|nr:hypothetical protein [Pseudolabrys sp.]